MKKCLICEIRKKAQDEFMDFLNWLSKKPYYEQIEWEYYEFLSKSQPKKDWFDEYTEMEKNENKKIRNNIKQK